MESDLDPDLARPYATCPAGAIASPS